MKGTILNTKPLIGPEMLMNLPKCLFLEIEPKHLLEQALFQKN